LDLDNNGKKLSVGKWMSYYQTEIFNESLYAVPFCSAFVQYLNDLEVILKYYQGKTGIPMVNSPIFLSFTFLKYQGYSDLIGYLIYLFKYRHNYLSDSKGRLYIYRNGTNEIDIEILEDISKRLNFTIIYNYLKNSTTRLGGVVENISKDDTNKDKLTLEQICENVCSNINGIFSLSYMSEPVSDPKPKINDNSKYIKAIFAIQQGFLSHVADKNISYYEHINDCLFGKFSIEHLYSISEYNKDDRLRSWQENKNLFMTSNLFDICRSSFENLCLLNLSDNSSLKDKEINDKLRGYRNASGMRSGRPEYLIQSLVEGSEYYKNEYLAKLDLPERKITEFKANTWRHSDNNKEFNIKLLEYALKAMI